MEDSLCDEAAKQVLLAVTVSLKSPYWVLHECNERERLNTANYKEN